jgi:hypothetical protein
MRPSPIAKKCRKIFSEDESYIPQTKPDQIFLLSFYFVPTSTNRLGTARHFEPSDSLHPDPST